MNTGQESQPDKGAFQPSSSYEWWLANEYRLIAGGSEEVEEEETSEDEESGFNLDDVFDNEDEVVDDEFEVQDEESEEEDQPFFEHEGQGFSEEQLREFIASRDELQDRAGKYDELYSEFTRKSQELAGFKNKEETQRKAASEETVTDYSHLDPEMRQAMELIDSSSVNPRLSALENKMMDSFEQTLNERDEALFKILGPLANGFQLESLAGNKQEDKDALENKVNELSQKYGQDIPLELANDLLKKEGNYEKGKAEQKANTQRKRNAAIPSGGGKPSKSGLKHYDPDTDSEKSFSELLEEGLGQL